MKIHSNVISSDHIIVACSKVPNIHLARFGQAGSRSHNHAYDVILTGSAKHRVMNNPQWQAATYDEWGYFISHLYDIDTEAKIGPYKNSSDFAEKTEWRYDTDGNYS